MLRYIGAAVFIMDRGGADRGVLLNLILRTITHYRVCPEQGDTSSPLPARAPPLLAKKRYSFELQSRLC